MSSSVSIAAFCGLLIIGINLASASNILWEQSCQYPKENCGIENQPIMGSLFEPGYSYIGSEYERVMLLDARYAGSSAARLITPYIKATWRQNVCLTLEYMIEDSDGIERMSVIQQDRSQTKVIYQVGEDKKGKWRVAKMDIILRGGIVRYFLEGRVNKGKTGALMVRSFQYQDGKCKPEYSPRSAAMMRRSRLMSRYFDLQGGN